MQFVQNTLNLYLLYKLDQHKRDVIRIWSVSNWNVIYRLFRITGHLEQWKEEITRVIWRNRSKVWRRYVFYGMKKFQKEVGWKLFYFFSCENYSKKRKIKIQLEHEYCANPVPGPSSKNLCYLATLSWSLPIWSRSISRTSFSWECVLKNRSNNNNNLFHLSGKI